MAATYTIDSGPHEGHLARRVAREMPSERFGKPGPPETWVICECGEAWGYVEQEPDEDGWPE